jgi:hypothetical protein
MPNDPTLYPGIPNPMQQVIGRQGSLEARIAALESRRDMVITPWAMQANSSNSFFATTTFPYYGGRLWIVSGGGLLFGGVSTSVYARVGINVANSSATSHITHSTGFWQNSQYIGLAMQTIQVKPYVGYLSAPTLTVGNNTLSAYIQPIDQPGAVLFESSGIIIEWPQA